MAGKFVGITEALELFKPRNLIKAGVKSLFRPGDIVEVRAWNKEHHVSIGRYKYGKELINVIDIFNEEECDVYYVMNPVGDALGERVMVGSARCTSEDQVPWRRWFLLDFDPRRDHAIASDEQCRDARQTAENARDWLKAYGYKGVRLAVSGNGAHLIVPCELPNDAASKELVRKVQRAVADRFSSATVEVECFPDANRLVRAYGSVNRKGEETEELGHRRSLIFPCDGVDENPKSIMERIVADNPSPEPQTKRHSLGTGAGGFSRDILFERLEAWADGWEGEDGEEFDFEETERRDGFRVRCPGSLPGGWGDGEEHASSGEPLSDASIVWVENGWPRFSCLHSHCGEGAEHGKKTWLDLQEFYDPERQLHRIIDETDYSAKWSIEYLDITDSKPIVTLQEAGAEYPSAVEDEAVAVVESSGEVPAETSRPGQIPLYRLTDAGNMERLIWRYMDKFLFCPQRDWFAWDDRRWKPDSTRTIIGAALRTVRQICKDELTRATEGVNDPDTLKKIVKKYKDWEETSEGRTRLEAMVALAECFIVAELGMFDSDRLLFNCSNGTLDLRTGELYPARRTDYITVVSDVVYDRAAECPLWMRFLNDVTNGNVELIAYLQRAVGYSLTGLTVEHCMFILWGTGRNGKSTFLEVVQKLMGEYARAAHMNTFMARKSDEGIPNDLAHLASARFVSATESDDGKRLAEAKIKQITGGDTVTARFLHKEFFDFVPQFKIWLGTNHKPTIYGTDEGIWRRIRLIPFDVYIADEKKDERLKEKLIAELPGILNWALRGLAEYRLRGMMEPEIVKLTTDEYRQSQDWMTRFLEEVTEPSTTDNVPSRKLYEKYSEWCQRTGEYKLSENKFAEGMKQKGMVSKQKRQADGKTLKAYEGMKLRDSLSGFASRGTPPPDVDDLSIEF